MQVILLEKVGKIGKLGDIVEVKDGFARNFLIPQSKAKLATRENITIFQNEKLKFEKREKEILKQAQEDAERLAISSITISQKAGVDGKLFGSVTNSDIAEAITKQTGITVKKTNVKLPSPYKTIGEYTVSVQLHHEVQVEIALSVLPLT